jgi:potassium large conductance calcium-activated channel subfamily M alpha protein 1
VPHIVLIGAVSQSSLTNFLEEYFHEDHGNKVRHCVLMRPNRPDPNTEMILMKPKFVSTLQYIEGNSLDPNDLKRALVQKAQAVIILSDKFSFEAEHEDTHTILEAMVIKNYLN